jgi:hypothetical protein
VIKKHKDRKEEYLVYENCGDKNPTKFTSLSKAKVKYWKCIDVVERNDYSSSIVHSTPSEEILSNSMPNITPQPLVDVQPFTDVDLNDDIPLKPIIHKRKKIDMAGLKAINSVRNNYSKQMYPKGRVVTEYVVRPNNLLYEEIQSIGDRATIKLYGNPLGESIFRDVANILRVELKGYTLCRPGPDSDYQDRCSCNSSNYPVDAGVYRCDCGVDNLYMEVDGNPRIYSVNECEARTAMTIATPTDMMHLSTYVIQQLVMTQCIQAGNISDNIDLRNQMNAANQMLGGNIKTPVMEQIKRWLSSFSKNTILSSVLDNGVKVLPKSLNK